MKRVVVALLLALASVAASAEEFTAVQVDKSSIAFVSRQMGVPVNGRFGKFSAQIRFDPAKPETGSVVVDIAVASIDAGSAEANDAVAGKDWFDAAAFPGARFATTAIRPLGGNRYEALGKLTIKGRTRDVAAPFTFASRGSVGNAEGTLVIKRADFGIGQGVWADFDTVANEVEIKFRLQAEASAAHK
ncbi:MAG TPA: YceI family protein [Rhodocyclaceae bacterium]|nr:YceI family protein [Rhodocyclaceae bacterium]